MLGNESIVVSRIIELADTDTKREHRRNVSVYRTALAEVMRLKDKVPLVGLVKH